MYEQRMMKTTFTSPEGVMYEQRMKMKTRKIYTLIHKYILREFRRTSMSTLKRVDLVKGFLKNNPQHKPASIRARFSELRELKLTPDIEWSKINGRILLRLVG